MCISFLLPDAEVSLCHQGKTEKKAQGSNEPALLNSQFQTTYTDEWESAERGKGQSEWRATQTLTQVTAVHVWFENKHDQSFPEPSHFIFVFKFNQGKVEVVH